MAHSTHCRRQQGFTIIELMIAVAIVGALAGLAIPNYLGYLDKARLTRCIAEIRYIERAIDSYEAANESLPNTLVEVGAGDMVDPWGNPYEYLNIAALTLPLAVVAVTGVGAVVAVTGVETTLSTGSSRIAPMRRAPGMARQEDHARIAFFIRSIPTMTCTVWARTVRA
ncbi:MAG: prepilin-type N-terminal cleavage/methylation domain-containing protein [Nitrospira sp.]|nr:prepilin-type N-terminal cleavage/methylation domain-containing protein [Nitrospira sp.]